MVVVFAIFEWVDQNNTRLVPQYPQSALVYDNFYQVQDELQDSCDDPIDLKVITCYLCSMPNWHNLYITPVGLQKEESGTDEAFTAVPPMCNSIRFASGGI